MIVIRYKIYFLLLFLGLTTAIFFLKWDEKSSLEIGTQDGNTTWTDHFVQEIKSLDGSDEPQFVIFGKNQIVFTEQNFIIDSWSRYNQLETAETFPDLFYFSTSSYFDELIDSKIKTINKVEVFPKADPQFLVILSIYNSGGSHLEAFGIYKLEENEIIRVFREDFRPFSGRSKYVRFSEEEAEFTVYEGEKVRNIYYFDMNASNFFVK